MAISSNPTKTRGIEKRWLREINKRWDQFEKETTEELQSIDFITVNQVETDLARVRAYMAFFESKINELLLRGTDRRTVLSWQSKYQLQAYTRAIEQGKAQLRAQGVSTALTQADFSSARLITGEITAAPAFGVSISVGSVAQLPIHQESLTFLYSRSFEKLNGWTDNLASETRQILFDGIRQGKGINELTREMVARTDVSRSRAQTIARTETIQAFQHGSINNTEVVKQETGIDIQQRWLTVRDLNVRDIHARWHGDIIDAQEASRRITVSPFNCRCGFSPVVVEFDTDAKKEKFKKEQKQLLDIKKQAKELKSDAA